MSIGVSDRKVIEDRLKEKIVELERLRRKRLKREVDKDDRDHMAQEAALNKEIQDLLVQRTNLAKGET